MNITENQMSESVTYSDKIDDFDVVHVQPISMYE